MSLAEIQSPVLTENFFDFREKDGNVDIWDEGNLVAKFRNETAKPSGSGGLRCVIQRTCHKFVLFVDNV